MTGVERGARHASPGVPVAHPFARALPLFLFAGWCFSSLDTTAKYLVRDHSLFLVVWARYAGQMLVVTPFAWHRAGPGFWHTKRLPLQLVRSSMLVIATFCFFAALRYLPLAEASAITFLAPIFIVLMSGPLLGERPTLGAAAAHGLRRRGHPKGLRGARGARRLGLRDDPQSLPAPYAQVPPRPPRPVAGQAEGRQRARFALLRGPRVR